ncbi:polysaccharide deacetylase family protein [Natronolimnohabitans innermongolicus]|uniref:Polysaccharide deacetylase n=1 Tax=Natronolimnohabitans innermongolicus JCM 12255 TaxID=1227499 RepID=L9WX78_9EURY|nr:polysaccharide deacetylase family protein [Natronolimnohabitans innermongolicus]ELY52963.1 polysaccharide deacetylase [Natronolimnohabitans innermongolicus JCM 12255]
MKRRAYLTLAASTSLCLAGCAELRSGDSNGDNGDDDGAPGSTSSSDSAGDHPDIAGTDDDFEDLDVWNVSGGDLSADPDRSVVGSQSARLEIPSGEGSAVLTKAFDEPRDLSAVAPGVAAASDELIVPWIRLLDVDGNSIAYRRGISGDLPLMRYNFGVDSTSSAFDVGAVTDVQLQVWTAENESRTVWFDDFHFTPRPETGKVMIQFDDTHVTDYTKALPILEEYGYPAVTFINSDYVGRDAGGVPRMSTEQLHELHDAGWCIANHTDTHPHLSQLSREEQEAEILDGKEWLIDQGFEEDAEYFAYPFGDYNATTIELVEKHHTLGFAGGRPVQGYTTNTELVSRIGEPDVERVERELERTVEMGGITKMFYHRLEDEHLEAFETLVETVHKYESQGDLEVILPQDLEERYLF